MHTQYRANKDFPTGKDVRWNVLISIWRTLVAIERHPLEIIGERLSLRGLAFLPPPFSSFLHRPPIFLPAFSVSPLRSCSRARRASSHSIGHCTRRRFSRAVSRVDARGMQPKAADVHRGRPKWATSVALAAATVISGSMHSHAQALCMHDSARMTQPAHEEYDLDPAARRCIAPSR